MAEVFTAPGRIEDEEGNEWYRERFGQWVKASRDFYQESPEIVHDQLRWNLDKSAEIKGWRLDPATRVEFFATDAFGDDLTRNFVSVMAETFALLTPRQEWELRIERAEAALQSYQEDLETGVDEDGDPIDDDDRQWRLESIDRRKAEIERLRSELATMA